ncbi:MAG: hypothetical protein ACK4E8_07290 [Lacibacter sp.]|jgi:hypothetical protein
MHVEILSGLQAVMHTAPVNNWHLLYPAGALLAAAAYAKKGKMKLMYRLLLSRLKKRRRGSFGSFLLVLLYTSLLALSIYGIVIFLMANKIILAGLVGLALLLITFLFLRTAEN